MSNTSVRNRSESSLPFTKGELANMRASTGVLDALQRSAMLFREDGGSDSDTAAALVDKLRGKVTYYRVIEIGDRTRRLSGQWQFGDAVPPDSLDSFFMRQPGLPPGYGQLPVVSRGLLGVTTDHTGAAGTMYKCFEVRSKMPPLSDTAVIVGEDYTVERVAIDIGTDEPALIKELHYTGIRQIAAAPEIASLGGLIMEAEFNSQPF